MGSPAVPLAVSLSSLHSKVPRSLIFQKDTSPMSIGAIFQAVLLKMIPNAVLLSTYDQVLLLLILRTTSIIMYFMKYLEIDVLSHCS